MLKIRDFARLAEVSMATLRYYDEIDLLRPAHVDPETAYRFYTIDQLPHVHRILAFKELGLELNQIIAILSQDLSPDVLQGMLRLRQAQIQQRIATEQEQLVRIEARLRSLAGDATQPAYDVVLKPVKSVTGVRLRLAQSELGQLAHWIDPLESLLRHYDITPIGHLIVLHPEPEDDRPAPFVDVVARVPWKDINTLVTASQGRLMRVSLPALPHVASTLHHGSPMLLMAAYHALGSWMQQNGYTIVGPRRKIRLRRGANLDHALTEIQFPVAKSTDTP